MGQGIAMKLRAETIIYRLSIIILAVTGLAQMPIFKRYYIADIPGFRWLAMYFVTHSIHYIGAAVFLFVVGLWGTRYVLSGRWRDSLFRSYVHLFFMAGVIVTGMLRTMKNFDSIYFDSVTVIVLDWGHLLFVLIWGMFCLAQRYITND